MVISTFGNELKITPLIQKKKHLSITLHVNDLKLGLVGASFKRVIRTMLS